MGQHNSQFFGTKLAVNVSSHEMQGRRRTMEDAQYCGLLYSSNPEKQANRVPRVLFAGIFDGHGGKEAAEFCRQNLHRHVARALELVKPPGTPERLHQGDAGSIDDERLYANEVLENAAAAVTQAYVQADAAFLASTGGDDDEMPEFLKPRAGATCCSVLVNLFTGQAIAANLGDTQAVLSRNRRAVSLSQLHKPTDPDERARIQRSGHYVSNGRLDGSLNVSRSIGDRQFKRPVSQPIPRRGFNLRRRPRLPFADSDEDLAAVAAADDSGEASPSPNASTSPGDLPVSCLPYLHETVLDPAHDEFILIACDGLFEVMTPQQAVDWVVRWCLGDFQPVSDPFDSGVIQLATGVPGGHSSNGEGGTASSLSAAATAATTPASKRRTPEQAPLPPKPPVNPTRLADADPQLVKSAAKNLCREAIRLGSMDNVSAVILFLTPPTLTRSTSSLSSPASAAAMFPPVGFQQLLSPQLSLHPLPQHVQMQHPQASLRHHPQQASVSPTSLSGFPHLDKGGPVHLRSVAPATGATRSGPGPLQSGRPRLTISIPHMLSPAEPLSMMPSALDSSDCDDSQVRLLSGGPSLGPESPAPSASAGRSAFAGVLALPPPYQQGPAPSVIVRPSSRLIHPGRGHHLHHPPHRHHYSGDPEHPLPAPPPSSRPFLRPSASSTSFGLNHRFGTWAAAGSSHLGGSVYSAMPSLQPALGGLPLPPGSGGSATGTRPSEIPAAGMPRRHSSVLPQRRSSANAALGIGRNHQAFSGGGGGATGGLLLQHHFAAATTAPGVGVGGDSPPASAGASPLHSPFPSLSIRVGSPGVPPHHSIQRLSLPSGTGGSADNSRRNSAFAASFLGAGAGLDAGAGGSPNQLSMAGNSQDLMAGGPILFRLPESYAFGGGGGVGNGNHTPILLQHSSASPSVESSMPSTPASTGELSSSAPPVQLSAPPKRGRPPLSIALNASGASGSVVCISAPQENNGNGGSPTFLRWHPQQQPPPQHPLIPLTPLTLTPDGHPAGYLPPIPSSGTDPFL